MRDVGLLVLGIIAAFAFSVLSSLARDEARGQIDRIPYAKLRLARRRVPRALRVRLHDEEWLPELHHILNHAQTRPISRLLTGTMFALGILRTARKISRQRAELEAPEIELRRLISVNIAVSALGNIVTAAVGYAFILVAGFTVGVGGATIIGVTFPRGNITPILFWPVKGMLFLIFGSWFGLMSGNAANRGIKTTFRYLIVPPPIQWVSRRAQSPGRSVRALSAFADLFTTVSGTVSLPGVIACISCLGGVALGIFVGTTIVRIISSILMAVSMIVAVAVTRVLVLIPLQLWYKHRHSRIAEPPAN